MAQVMRFKVSGAAQFECVKHKRSLSLSYGAGYPLLEHPACSSDGKPMTLVVGSHDPSDDLETVEVPSEGQPEQGN